MDYKLEIEHLKEMSQYRELRTMQPLENGFAMVNGERLLNLSSNDYLGLAVDIDLKNEFQSLLASHPEWQLYSASSSRMLSGNNDLYNQVEILLSQMYGRSALFFNSGYHANLAILPALTTKSDLIISDKLLHASIIDGIKLSSATHIRFRHNDYQHLIDILSKNRHLYSRVFIVAESIFSMDGDVADLQQLIDIKKQFDALIYLDEAHAVGVRGLNGLGLAEEMNVIGQIDFIIGTMGKALSSVGAYVVCAENERQWLINKARPFIYSTALPPINMAWSWFVLSRCSMFNDKRKQLQTLMIQLEKSIQNIGFHSNSQSHIIPVLIGDNDKTVAMSNYLQTKGVLILPIRPPTVPVGTSRLRMSLSAAMSWDDLSGITGLISEFSRNEYQVSRHKNQDRRLKM
jgi:8-amino-7-oxononanoate synthase